MTTRVGKRNVKVLALSSAIAVVLGILAVGPGMMSASERETTLSTGGPTSAQPDGNWVQRAPDDVRAGKYDEACGADPCEDRDPAVRKQGDRDGAEGD